MREVTDESTVAALAGNGHGQRDGVQLILQCLFALEVTRLTCTGDFGIWFGADSRRFTQRINDFAEDARITLTVTPGNHEDGKLGSAVFTTVGSGIPASIRSRLAVLSRGYRWAQAGRTYVWFGGAASIDCESCQVGCSWILGKLPPAEDFVALTASGHAEIMIVHASPAPGTPKANRIRATANGWRENARKHAAHGAEIITSPRESVHSRLHVHGHFHLQDGVNLPTVRRIVCIIQAQENRPGIVMLLDPTTMTSTRLEAIPE